MIRCVTLFLALTFCVVFTALPSYAATQTLGTNVQTDILKQSGDAAPIENNAPAAASEPGKQVHMGVPLGVSKEYVLGIGDHILLTVYGEEDISGEYVVGSTGIASIPLIGNVQAANNTVGQLEDLIRAKLAQGYFKDPKVSIEVSNYRPFFILGEVAKPGSYPYVNGLTVLNAVALAGGYTYRASTSRIKIVHANDPKKEERPAEESESVAPGDLIRVPERYF